MENAPSVESVKGEGFALTIFSLDGPQDRRIRLASSVAVRCGPLCELKSPTVGTGLVHSQSPEPERIARFLAVYPRVSESMDE